MAYQDWETKAQDFLKASKGNYAHLEDPDKIRMTLIDTHATLECVLRGYLVDTHQLEQVRDAGQTNFPKLVQIAREKAGNWIIDAATDERLNYFNNLRNRVTHAGQTASLAALQELTQISRRIINRLLPGWSIGVPLRPARQPLSLLTGSILTSAVALYIILPDLLPLNPLDDILLGGPCALVAAILVFVAYRQQGRKS